MLRVADRDWKPPSLLDGGGLSPGMVIGGTFAVVGAHLAFPVLSALVIAIFEALGVIADQAEVIEERIEARRNVQIVEARLVKAGRILDPRRLPSKVRNNRSTAPERVSNVPHKNARRVAPPDAAVPRDPLLDTLARLGTRADELARADNLPEQEGDPEGVEGGTETRETGDIYAGVLYGYFRRGWETPSSILDEDLRSLVCTVEIDITSDAHLGGWRIANGSGNDEFDESVRTRLRQAEGASLPDPPPDEAAQFLGASVRLRFLGRHAR